MHAAGRWPVATVRVNQNPTTLCAVPPRDAVFLQYRGDDIERLSPPRTALVFRQQLSGLALGPQSGLASLSLGLGSPRRWSASASLAVEPQSDDIGQRLELGPPGRGQDPTLG